MPKTSNVVYWDTCVFLCKMKREDGRVETLDAIVEDAESGKIKIVTSVITKLETKHLGVPKPTTNADYTKIAKFFQHEWIYLRIVDPKTVDLALEYRRAHHLSLPDSIHVASAKLAGASELHSWDPKILEAQGKISGLNIVEPYHGQPFLPIPQPKKKK